jgi:hypothetical protein
VAEDAHEFTHTPVSPPTDRSQEPHMGPRHSVLVLHEPAVVYADS